MRAKTAQIGAFEAGEGGQTPGNTVCYGRGEVAVDRMNIRFISSLTPEDEERIAPVVLNAVGMLLDQLPLAFTLRIETSNEKVYQHSHAGIDETDDHPPSPLNGAALAIRRATRV